MACDAFAQGEGRAGGVQATGNLALGIV